MLYYISGFIPRSNISFFHPLPVGANLCIWETTTSPREVKFESTLRDVGIMQKMTLQTVTYRRKTWSAVFGEVLCQWREIPIAEWHVENIIPYQPTIASVDTRFHVEKEVREIYELDASNYTPPSIPGLICRGILGGVIRGRVWLIEMPPPADMIPPEWLEPGGKLQNGILRIGQTRWQVVLRQASRNCPDASKIVTTLDAETYFVLTLLSSRKCKHGN